MYFFIFYSDTIFYLTYDTQIFFKFWKNAIKYSKILYFLITYNNNINTINLSSNKEISFNLGILK